MKPRDGLRARHPKLLSRWKSLHRIENQLYLETQELRAAGFKTTDLEAAIDEITNMKNRVHHRMING